MAASPHNPIICALDTDSLSHARELAAELKDTVGMFKLGLEFFATFGASGVRDIAQYGTPIFLDLKFHDIPNTVSAAVRGVTRLGVSIITVHAVGGYDMLKAAADSAADEAAKRGLAKPLIAAVTVLTSMNNADLQETGVQADLPQQVKNLAALAKRAGIGGAVCSPHEIRALKEQCGADFRLVVPGIRPEGAASGDQKRIMTPKEAVALGADYLVIGRPITQAADPGATARAILKTL